MSAAQSHFEQAEQTKQFVEQLANRFHQLDTLLNDQEKGLLKENALLKDETVQLRKTCNAYENRLVEMEVEVQVSTLTLIGDHSFLADDRN